nr:hypothetical protein HK105_000667 [Polyrhizophydium stewartii]
MLGRRTAAPAASAAPVDFAGEVLALAESVASRARLLRSKRSRAGALARHAQLVAAQLASMVDSVRDEDTLAVLVQAQSMLAAIDLFLGETAAMTFMQQTGSAGRTARAIRDYAAQLLRTEKSLELVSETLLPAAANTKTPNPKSPASPTIVKLARESVEMTTAVYANQRAATALASRAELVALAVADQSYDSHDHAAQEGLDKLMATLTAIQRFIARTAAKCVLHQLLLARTAADIIRDLDEQISHVLPMLRLALMLRAGTVAKAIEQDASEMPDLVKRLVSDAQIKFNVPQQ